MGLDQPIFDLEQELGAGRETDEMSSTHESLVIYHSHTIVCGQRQIAHGELDIRKIGIHLGRSVVAFAERHHQLMPLKMLASKLRLGAGHVAVARGTRLGDNEFNVGVVVNHNRRRRVPKHIQIEDIVLFDERDHHGNGFGAILYAEAATRKRHSQWNGNGNVVAATNSKGHKIYKSSVAGVFNLAPSQIVKQFHGYADAEKTENIIIMMNIIIIN